MAASTSKLAVGFIRDIYGDHNVSCTGIVGIKHRHNIMCDTLVDICFRSGISAGKEVDIRLGGGRDKPLSPADMLLYSWDEGLDVFVDLIGCSYPAEANSKVLCNSIYWNTFGVDAAEDLNEKLAK
nr:hypothetical protein [Tanacetum cinerariifolium]